MNSAFSFPHDSVTVGWIFSNLAGVCSSPGDFFLIYCSDISTNQRGHVTKNVFFFDG